MACASGEVWAATAGTAIETNINGQFKFTLHKKASLMPMLQNLTYPLLENANEYVIHGYTVSVRLPCVQSKGNIAMPWQSAQDSYSKSLQACGPHG